MGNFLKYTIPTCMLLFLLSLNACDNDSNEEMEVIYTVQLSGTSTVNEGETNVSFNVELDKVNASGAAISLNYDVTGSSQSSNDFTPLSGLVSIQNGERIAVVAISLNDDTEDESDENIVITLSASRLPNNVIIGSSSSVTITITDNDELVANCTNDNSTSTDDNGCNDSPTVSNTYDDSNIENGNREIVTNSVPEHDFSNQLKNKGVSLKTETLTYLVAATPTKSNAVTSILSNSNRPRYRFGIAKNGVPMDPAPAEPFIFENTNTGEYNWDWVFEPTQNTNQVSLDCAYAHVQPDGTYHYHGDMQAYANQLVSGLGDGTTAPSEAIQIGWAADGFPIYYKYAPTANGDGVEKLNSGYVLKSGERPGDGITAPCGEYNGKYTNDFTWSANAGDLDECNGIDRTVTINGETYAYFYVITDDFPVIPRCLAGTPNDTFRLGGN